jgi:FXSXX-COOH protein
LSAIHDASDVLLPTLVVTLPAVPADVAVPTRPTPLWKVFVGYLVRILARLRMGQRERAITAPVAPLAIMAAPAVVDGFDLVDLSDVDLADLCGLDDSGLDHSLRRVLADIDSPQSVVAGWNSVTD